MKIEGYQEISEEEYEKLSPNEGASFTDWETGEENYFKKAQKFPINFQIDSNHDIDILSEGEMEFNHDDVTVFTVLPEEIPKLVKAVEKAKEVIKNKWK